MIKTSPLPIQDTQTQPIGFPHFLPQGGPDPRYHSILSQHIIHIQLDITEHIESYGCSETHIRFRRMTQKGAEPTWMCLQDPSKSHPCVHTSLVCCFLMQAPNESQIVLFEFLFEKVTGDPSSQKPPSMQQSQGLARERDLLDMETACENRSNLSHPPRPLQSTGTIAAPSELETKHTISCFLSVLFSKTRPFQPCQVHSLT